MKKIGKFLIPVALICIVTVAVVLIIQAKSMPIKTEEVVANLEWNMSREDAKIAMARNGYTDFESVEAGGNMYLQYIIENYQGVEGANCELTLVFQDNQLTSGRYRFCSYESFEAQTSTDKINELQIMLAKGYEKDYKDSISEEYHSPKEPDAPDYGRYFVGEESLVFICRESENQLTVTFENVNAPGQKELIEALKELEATKAPSPTGLYDGVPQ